MLVVALQSCIKMPVMFVNFDCHLYNDANLAEKLTNKSGLKTCSNRYDPLYKLFSSCRLRLSSAGERFDLTGFFQEIFSGPHNCSVSSMIPILLLSTSGFKDFLPPRKAL